MDAKCLAAALFVVITFNGASFGSEQLPSSPLLLASYRTRTLASSEPRGHGGEPLEPRQTDVPGKAVDSPVDDAAGATSSDGEEGEGDAEDEEDAEEEEGPLLVLGERWHELGPITAAYLYTGEAFNNAHGGLRTNGATRYRGSFDLTLTLDTGKANWWSGGEIFVYAQQSHGRTLTSEFIGDGQYYSNLDTNPMPQDLTQLGEYWYRHRFGEDLWSLKLGRQDANAEFAFADLGGDFVNSSFVTIPIVPLPTWPLQTFGVSGLYQPGPKLRLGGGIYDHGRDRSQWWMTATNRGTFFLGQLDYQPFADQEDAPLTLIRLGTWYTSSDTAAVDGSRDFEGNHGVYATVDRMLFRERESAQQGFGALFQFSWAPTDRNAVDRNVGAGFVYRGLLPGRDEDTLGTGFTRIEFSPILRNQTGQTFEHAIELFYKARVDDWLAIQPDLQYIVRPGGAGRDAFLVGLRMEVNF